MAWIWSKGYEGSKSGRVGVKRISLRAAQLLYMARRWTPSRYKLILLCGGLFFLVTLSLLHSQIYLPCDCPGKEPGGHNVRIKDLDAQKVDSNQKNHGNPAQKFGLGLENDGAGDSPLFLPEAPEVKFSELHDDHPEWGPHKLALIIPFRDRFDELLEFVPHMHKYLNLKKIRHKIYVMNQVDSLRFNRASLINVGYLQSQTECDYLAMHDVDLLPLNPDLEYSYPEKGPFHVAAPDLHPKYHYRTFVGGILLVNGKHFKQLNGLSNSFWGWGREDDEFYVRIKEAGLNVHRPYGITTGLDTFKHIHDKQKRPRDNYRYGNQKKASRKRDRVTGVDTIEYSIESVQDLTIDSAPVSIVNVHLECKLDITPWCVSPENLQPMVDLVAADMTDDQAQLLEQALEKHGLPAKVKDLKQKN